MFKVTDFIDTLYVIAAVSEVRHTISLVGMLSEAYKVNTTKSNRTMNILLNHKASTTAMDDPGLIYSTTQ